MDEHSDISMPSDMLVDQWFDYWIGIKKKTVRSNTVRNYTERYIKNIKPVVGKMSILNPKQFRFAEVWNIVTVQRSGVSENQRVNQVTVRYL